MDEGSDNAMSAAPVDLELNETEPVKVETRPAVARAQGENGPVVRPRRRGAALEAAIHDAVFSELAEVGYAALTVEAVATRAQTGKASIYRRWPTKHELVIDAFCAKFSESEQIIEDVAKSDLSTRDVLVALANRVVAICAEDGEVFRAVSAEVTRFPELAAAIEEQVHCPKRDAMVGLLTRGVARGEVRPEAACELFAELLPAVIMYRVLLMNRSIADQDVEAIVDHVVMPLVSSGR